MTKKTQAEEQELQEALAELRALPRPVMDFTTPEGAILCLEDALRRQDIEAVAACKDFQVEAVLLLSETMPEQASDDEMVARTAEVLELAYRKEISGNWPKMEGVESFFVDRQLGFQDLAIVIVTEVSLMPDGTFSQTRLRVSKRNDEWRVLNPLPVHDDEDPRVQRHEVLAPGYELPEVEGRYEDAILRHIEATWGKSELLSDDTDPEYVRVRVHVVRATEEHPFHTLITSGMSDRPMTVPEGAEEYRLAELVICLPASWPLDQDALEDESHGWPVQWLKQLALMPHQYNTWLFCGHTVPNGDPATAFAPDTELCCMLLASPALCDDEGTALAIDDETVIHFHSLIPIYREEMEFALSNSSDDLLERLGDADVSELVDLERPNLGK
jgi:hypothetical protein